MLDVPTTQRAYTLRLSGLSKDDSAWRDALWATHEAVNRGAKVFGDWLLTLRGGLDHRLADEKVKGGKGKRDREPTQDERRDRRILLAISWLSVESKNGSPPDQFYISSGIENGAEDRIEALREILRKRKVPKQEVDSWVADCSSSLNARIRTDACWVNRSAIFDAVTEGWNRTEAREDARILLWHVLNDDYLKLPKSEKVANKSVSEEDDGGEGVENKEDRHAAAVKSSRGAANRTRHPFSHLFGAGRPFGKEKKVLSLRNRWFNYLAPQISGTGIPLQSLSEAVKKSEKKQGRKSQGGSTDLRAPTELQREMFSKAASRLAQIWTKQRQQEADRRVRSEAATNLSAMLHDPSHSSAVALLDAYCEERQVETGALDSYHIRPSQLGGWKQVVAAWTAVEGCDPEKMVKARIAVAKELQKSGDIDKFGDINLFVRLAEEEYRPVWWHNGKDTSILEGYVKGTKARVDSERLKVAAYRHPDCFLNPVFCQFGTSRPDIKFARLKQLTAKNGVLDPRDVGMLLWHPNSNGAKLTLLKAISKRFDFEIGSIDESQRHPNDRERVSRRGRLGAASVGIPANQRAGVAGVFDAKAVKSRDPAEVEESDQDGDTTTKGPQWNGTLMANRGSLKAIADILDCSRKTSNVRLRTTLVEKAQKQISCLRWKLGVSMELESRGPGLEFAKRLPDGFNFDYKKHRLYHEDNRNRGYRARIALARLPGLRLLSVDLGHRYAASCAVWCAVSAKEVREDCIRHGEATPTADDLFICITHRGKAKRRTLYRRIAADFLPGRKTHPAPWARLERQFLIKLQGEDQPARWTIDDECAKFDAFVTEIGLKREKKAQDKHVRVDALMADAVAIAARGLRRHGTRAKIAFQLTAKEKHGMGGKGIKLDRSGRIDLLADTLVLWRDLATDEKWTDQVAKKLWNAHIKSMVQGTEPVATDDSPQARKKRREALKTWLRPVAERLATDASLCSQLHSQWAATWSEQDDKWRKRVRWLRKWLLPRRKDARKDENQVRDLGGLSITRLASIREVYHLLKAFHMRPEPDDPRKNIPIKGDDSIDKFGKRILDKLERMRENRVKQCASRLVEAALGVGAEPGRGDKQKQLPRAMTAKYEACHAVVIENLQNYRPDELQTRRENRQLMQWSAGKVRKYLEEGCRLHGLLLCEVNPAYTSRQDSRTGKPGVRSTDISVEEFLSPHWLIKRAVKDILDEELPGEPSKLVAAVKKAARKAREENVSARNRYLVDLYCHWAAQHKKDRKDRSVRIPVRGGEIFVTADKGSPIAGGLQSDLNAAANIGLKALLDPDWPGAWWFVPCDPKTGKPPLKDPTKGSTVFADDKPIPLAAAERHEKPKRLGDTTKDDRQVVNAWRDPSGTSVRNSQWLRWKEYWEDVETRVIAVLRKHAKLDAIEDDNPF